MKSEISFDFAPLNIILNEIWGSEDEAMNEKCFEITHKYLKEQKTIYCFTEQSEVTEKYLAEITGQNGAIDTERARNIIRGSLGQLFPEQIETLNKATA